LNKTGQGTVPCPKTGVQMKQSTYDTRRRGKKWGRGLIIFIHLLIVTWVVYCNIYYHADTAAKEYLKNPSCYQVEKKKDYLVFWPEGNIQAGMIFYPGGKVEYTAYAPLMGELAKRGIASIVVRMPANLAVLDINGAAGIQKKYPEIEKWYMSGHSLGGAMAAKYVGKHITEYSGLIMLGAYSVTDLSATNLAVLSVYGTEDHVMKMQNYETSKINLPSGSKEMVIASGCHGYFGSYGEQRGDGEAGILPQEQWNETAEAICNWIETQDE